MKIIHIISSPAAGGAEVYVKDLSIRMRRKGHEVHIVFLESALESGRDLSYENKFLNSLTSELISYSFLGSAARKRPWIGVIKLRKLVSEFRPNIIHCHLYYGLLFSFFTRNIAVLYTHHSFRLGLPKFFYRILDLKVHCYIGICNACKTLLDARGRAVFRIDNAVSSERLEISVNQYTRMNSDVIFVFVGSLREPKNVQLLLRSFAALLGSTAKLRIVGEGPQRSELERLAVSLKIDKQVEFLGNRTDVTKILASSDVFVMSSVWEGLPIALLEATVQGLPVIVTNVGGCAEVVHECANGFVVDTLTEADYARALKKMYHNDSIRVSFSKNALAFSSNYEIQIAAKKHLDLYENTLLNSTRLKRYVERK